MEEDDGLGATAWAVPLEGDQAPADAILCVLRDEESLSRLDLEPGPGGFFLGSYLCC